MADCPRAQLLGLLLGALEESERESVEEKLKRDPQSQEELRRLRRTLSVLESARPDYAPPRDLAARTCRAVSLFADAAAPARAAAAVASGRPRPRAAAVGPAAASALPQTPVAASPAGRGGRWGWLDVLAAATVLAASAMLVFPALQHSRFDARLAACQENLHRLHLAAAGQSGRYYGGFPAVLRRGRLAPTGAYAAMPVSEGNLPESVSVVGLDWSLSGDGSLRGRTLGAMPAAPASDPSASRLPGYHGLSLEGRGQVLWGDGRVTFFPSASLLDESEGMFVNAHVPAARRGGAPVRSSAAVPVVFVANPR